MNSIPNKKLKVPKVDLKMKPNYDLLMTIGKNAAQDISPHPFTKVKKPKEEKIEQIFDKQSNSNNKQSSSKNKKSNSKNINKKNLKPIKKKKVYKSTKKKSN